MSEKRNDRSLSSYLSVIVLICSNAFWIISKVVLSATDNEPIEAIFVIGQIMLILLLVLIVKRVTVGGVFYLIITCYLQDVFVLIKEIIKYQQISELNQWLVLLQVVICFWALIELIVENIFKPKNRPKEVPWFFDKKK